MKKAQLALLAPLLILISSCAALDDGTGSSCAGANGELTDFSDEIQVFRTNFGQRAATSFQLDADTTITDGRARLGPNGTVPTSTVTFTIESDSAGEPDGTPLATGTIDSDDITTTDNYSFTFASSVLLSASTTYWLVMRVNYSSSNLNNISWKGSGTAGGSRTVLEQDNLSNWVVPSSLADLGWGLNCAE